MSAGTLTTIISPQATALTGRPVRAAGSIVGGTERRMANELDIDKMLKAAEKGKSASSLGKTERGVYGITPRMPSPQPDQKKNTMPAPKSYAPAGAGFKKLPSNIGLMVQKEAMKVFSGNPIKKAGKPVDPASYLPYRKPAIEGGEGPHAV